MIHNPFLQSILQKSATGPCISMIIPAERDSSGRPLSPAQVNGAVEKAMANLRRSVSRADADVLQQKLDSLIQDIDLDCAPEGVGLYVSADQQEAVPFFFPVKETFLVDDRFLIRALLHQDYYAAPYLVLLLSGKEARLFDGKFCRLTPVEDGHFPVLFEDEYEYNRPSRSTSNSSYALLKDVERDKSQLEDLRYQAFLKKLDALLHTEHNRQRLLIVAGTREDVAQFKLLSQHPVAGTVHGNPADTPLHTIAALAWEQYRAFLDHEKQNWLGRLNEAPRNHVVAGLSEAWKAAGEGRGARLFVEQDFAEPGYFCPDDQYLYSTPPFAGHYLTLPDAVDVLMQTVIGKGGDVLQVESHSLEQYHRIALITRY